ncbi:VOC family protein [Pseudokineococcus sp. 5B2Z-1]|uniref:VOC family protein n=1 Tax=Pseudokineococcus sp. 5B2Z-1 TaxID=3132744 RepID=UPI0030B7DB4D
MDVSSVTVGLPVSDLARAVAWYQRVLELGEPDVEIGDDLVEFQVGPVWLQLGQGVTARSGAEVVLRLGVADAAAERTRMVGLGVEASPVEHVEGVVDHFELHDPDGNRLGVYALVEGSPTP